MRACTLLLSLSILAAAPAAAAAQGLPDEPDLTIEFRATPYGGQPWPVFVDAFEEPGKLLYRFDAIIHNGGGTLDVYGGRTSVRQALWPGGQPPESTPPHPAQEPPLGTPFSDRTPFGASFDYVEEVTHEHWHFFSAARYELDVPGEGKRVSDKIGFCMFDSFDTNGPEEWFVGGDWCRPDQPGTSFVRMGLSPGASDRYSAQREFQYVDVTGLAPGPYLLRGIANPNGELVESDMTNNVRGEFRELPGVRAAPQSATLEPGTSRALALSAEIVAPQIPARRDGECRLTQSSCYVKAGDAAPALAVADPPAHGTVTLAGATATYTPAPGFVGTDRFTYTATDARGLRSAPAAVDLRVERPAGATPPPPPPAVTPPRRLLRIGAARRTRRALLVPISCRPAATGTCAGAVTARLAGRRLARRAFAGVPAGAKRTVRLRLTRADRRALARAPRRRIVLTAEVRDGLAAGVRARRVLARAAR